MNFYPRKLTHTLLLVLLAASLLLLGSPQPVMAQTTTTLSRAEVDRMLYVSNAFDIIERTNTPELAALAFTINATFQQNPKYPPERLLQELDNARARYNTYYRSAFKLPQNRFAIAPYEAVVTMLGILAALPGERDAVARQFLTSEAVNFGSLLDQATYLSEAIPAGGNSAPAGVFQASSALGRGRGQEIYIRYRKQQFYALYDLAKSNKTAQQVIDLYFGKLFQTSTEYSGRTILKGNPSLLLSANFKRLAPYFQWNPNLPNYGTFTIDTNALASVVEGFQRDALQATQQLSQSLTTVYNTYQRDYAAYSLDPAKQQAAAAALAGPLTAFNQHLTGLSGFANVVDLSLPSSSSDTQSKISASLGFTGDILSIGAGLASPGAAGKLGVLGGVLSMAGSAMGFADAFGLGGSSGPSNQDLADGLNELNQNLRTVARDLANRMNTIDAHLITLYRATSEGFNTVLYDIAVLNAGITQIQEDARYLIYLAQSNQTQLYSLSQSIYAFFNAYNQDQRLQLRGYLATLDNALRNVPDSVTYNDHTTGPFFYNTLRNYATLNAMSSTEVGSFGLANEDYGPERLRSALTLYSDTPEQTLNYLCGYADRLVNTPPYSLALPALRSPLQSGDLGGYLVNEPAWEMSMAGLLRLDAALPAGFMTATQNDGPANSNSHFGMRSLGRNLQRTAANVTLQFRAATDNSQPSPRYFPSPRLSTLLTDYNTKAVNFLQKVTALKRSMSANRIAISAGSFHGLALKSDGTVVGWGDNHYGQVGDGTTRNIRLTPVPVTGLTNVTTIAGAYDHSLAIKSDGTVWAWGSNDRNESGAADIFRTVPTPIQISGLTNATAIAGGYFHSMALKSDGTVWTWGYSNAGQIGNGTIGNVVSRSPTQVIGLTNVTAIAAGGQHSLAVKSDGTVWAWGWNELGQLGDGTTDNHPLPVQVYGLTDVIAVSASNFSSYALKSDGTVWAWGLNHIGQLGDGTTDSRLTPVPVSGLSGVTAIAAGENHALALKSDGTVWAWGANYAGEVGDGTTTQRNSPVPVNGLTRISAIAAGQDYSFALKSDGTIMWAWGRNDSGQFGDGTTTNHTTPVVSFSQHAAARPYIKNYILDIANRYHDGTSGTQNYSLPAAADLYTAFRDLQNARTVLERFISLGLSRSLAADTLLRALLYANVSDPFPTDPVTGAVNPNYGKVILDCQRLPDMDWITALYAGLPSPTDPDPQDIITDALPPRVAAFQNYLTPVLQNLANEANARRYSTPFGNVTAQLVLGEPLANVELMLRRFDAFTMTKVTGTMQASDPNATPALRSLRRNGLSLQVALRNDSVAEPLLVFSVTPTLQGAFTFTLPDGVFEVLVKAPGFLQRLVVADTSLSGRATLNLTLIPGDLSGDNRIDQDDLALLQRAMGSTPYSRNWNPLADLNGDGVVTGNDQFILQQQMGRTGDRF